MMIIEAPYPNRNKIDRFYKSRIISSSFLKNKCNILNAEIVISYSPRCNLKGEITRRYIKPKEDKDYIEYAMVLLNFYLPNISIKKIKLIENQPTLYPSLKIFIKECNVCSI
jgi:hypothetical protein